MKRSHSILSNGHIFNSLRSIDPPDTGAVKHKVKLSLSLNSSRCPSSRSLCDFIGTAPIPSTTQPCMDKVTNDPGSLSNPAAVPSTYFASPIRILKESLKDPDTHNISTHDVVEAYNSLSTKLRDRIHDISSIDVTLSFMTIFKEESQLLSDCLMRDIGQVLPNSFASQQYNDSLANLSFYSEETPNDDDIQTLTENNMLCQFALRFVSDIFTFPNMHCNFTDHQLVSLFDYALQLCKTKTSSIFNIEKHSAMVLWILKVQQLPLFILSSLKKEIILAIRNSISHDLGGYVAKLDAFKAVRSILRRYPSCSSWLVELLPLILDHIASGNPEIAIHAAMACSGFASAKMDSSQTEPFPSERAAKYVENYVDQETSRRIPSHTENVLFSFFKSAVKNIPRWQRLGLSFAFTVVSCFIILLDHRIFLKSSCIKFVVCVLRECSGQLRSVHKEAWGLLFWAYSRLPLELEHNGIGGKPSTKERSFRVISQDGRRVNLIASLLRAGELEIEGKRSEEDVSRAIKVLGDLVGSKLAEVRHEGAMLLARMMASIGSPSTTCSQTNELPFSRELIDDSILMQPTANIKVPPVRIPIERLPPLTEAEVLCHWDRLTQVWISIAQQVLNTGQELSPEAVQTWQALLLVRGEIMPGQEHLTGSQSFSSEIISILTQFTAALDGPEMQICYLSFIRKLWSVMKNVFAGSFLSSPGESILAALLKRSFTLVDDRVKDLWSQLCGDLISVGVPSLLRAVHLRPSESQEEQEMMQQLWTVLAKNGSLVIDAEDWETLLNLLVMPLGMWDLSTTELETWDRILAQALDGGEKASRTRQDVISRLLSLCTEPKMASLKQSPRILRSLLAQSSISSDPCSPTNIRILSWIDDSLSDSYFTLEDRDCAIATLRLIGEVISNTAESDIVRLLSTVQKSLVQWIADEERRLEGDEDDELVDALYMRSLDILARVEPSIAILEKLTAFLTSVFGRIRGQGPLAFYNFWRATYHKRDDIPKSEIPLSIKQKLKSWADVTQSSIGDGISFDSGSESLKSYTIPDSQPMAFKDVDLINQGLPLDANTELMITTHEYQERYGDDDAMTPVPRSRFTEPGVQGISGLLALQDYSSRNSGDSDSSKGSLDDHHIYQERSRSPGRVASTSKRSADSDTSGSRTPKRRKLEVPREAFKPRAGKEKARDEGEDLEILAMRNSLSKSPVSGPVTRIPSPYLLLQKSSKQSSQSRRSVKEGETSSMIEIRSESFGAQNPEQDPFFSFSHAPPDYLDNSMRRTFEDYDSWERNVTWDEVKRVRAELQQGSSVVRDEEPKSDGELEGEITDNHESDDHDILSPSLGDYPLRSRARQRSQTAPEQSFSSLPMAVSRTLRRNRTTPVEGTGRKGATSRAQVDVLQKAYAIVTDTGASQVDVHDIVEAKSVLNQINQVLDERMSSKLGRNDHGV